MVLNPFLKCQGSYVLMSLGDRSSQAEWMNSLILDELSNDVDGLVNKYVEISR